MMKTRLIALFLLLLFNSTTWAQRPFITVWKAISSNYIVIPTLNLLTYNYDIEWENLDHPGQGNGMLTNYTQTCTLSGLVSGDHYKVKISGLFPKIHMTLLDTFERRKLISIEQWGDIVWLYINYEGCKDLVLNAIDSPDLTQVVHLKSMFENCTNFVGHPSMNNWNTSNITNMQLMFQGCKRFNAPIGNWNTGNVTDMRQMFNGCTDFNQPIGNWDVSKVIYMGWMFYNCENFNQPIGNWVINSAESVHFMFYGAKKFNQSLANWNNNKVDRLTGMFQSASSFNQNPGFYSNLIDILSTFENATSFNQPLNNWNTSNVSNTFQLFKGATSFNQNLGSWNVTNLKSAIQMLDSSGLSIENYDSTLIGWSSQNLQDSVTLGALNKQYCNSVMERKSMIISYKWNFVGDVQSCLTEVEETLENPQILLYPNPNIGSFTLQSIENDRYEIYDVHGKRVSEGMIFAGKNTIQVTLASGLYVIKLLDQDKNIKMVVE